MSHKIICKNKKAYFDYEIIEKYECGLVLLGKEIKAIRDGKVNINVSYGRIFGRNKQELYLVGANIGAGEESDRTIKLLVNKSELKTLIGKTQIKGLSLVPLELYIKRGKAKILIAVAKGRKIYDKRKEIKKKDLDREARSI